MITFDEFKKVEITVGKILSVEKVPDTDKLLKLSVDFGLKLPPPTPPSKGGEEANPSTLQKAVLPFPLRIKLWRDAVEKGESVTTPSPSLEQEGREEANPSAHQNEPLPLGKGEFEARDVRQIISGIALYFPDEQILVGKKCMFVTNLEPRVIRGLESNGMLFAVSTGDGKFSLLEPNGEIPEGTRAR